MSRSVFSLATAVSFVLLTQAAPAGVKVDELAPDFNLVDSNGKQQSLSEYRGKYVVLEWVNYDCPFVHKHYSSGNMQKLQNSYRAKDVVWLSICSSAPGKQGHFESEDLKERMAEEKAAPTAYLIDSDGKVGKMYDAKTTPHMFVINPKGILIYAGGIDDTPSTDVNDIPKAKNYVQAALDEALAGKSVSTKGSRSYGCSVKYK